MPFYKKTKLILNFNLSFKAAYISAMFCAAIFLMEYFNFLQRLLYFIKNLNVELKIPLKISKNYYNHLVEL